jgi:hypothetical protein
MKKLIIVACAVVFAGATTLSAQQGPKGLNVRLDGYQEDPMALSTPGHGEFHARISNDTASVAYELSYTDLATPVQQAHIHLGRHSQSGGVIVFLCSNLPSPPPGTPACPASPGTVSGVLEAADVIGPAGQGIAAGEFAEFLRALRTGSAYVNVHTEAFPGGEIRGNVGGLGGHGGGRGQGHDH